MNTSSPTQRGRCAHLRSAPPARLRLNRLRGAALLALLLGACAKDATPDARASASDPLAKGPPPLDLVTDAPWPQPYADDAGWRSAAAGDDLDHARLARGESATSLLAALGHGGSLGRLALLALPHVEDRHAARGPLCELLGRATPASLGLLLTAVYASASGPRTEETVDPAADASCARALSEMQRRASLAPADRDRAAAALDQLRPR